MGLCAGRARVESNPKGKPKGGEAEGEFSPPTYLWKLRAFFLALGAILILLCLALVGPGLSAWAPTAISTRKVNRDVQDAATQGLLIMDSVTRVQRNVGNLDIASILDVAGACPNIQNNTFVSDKVLRRSIKNVERQFDELETYLNRTDSEKMRGYIDAALDGTEYVETAVTYVERNDWTARMFALVTIVAAFFLMLAAATSGRSARCRLPALTCMAELGMLPIFMAAVAVAWVATAGLAFASISNAGE